MNRTLIVNAIKSIGDQIELEKNNLSSQEPVDGKQKINKIKDVFEAIDVRGETLINLKSLVTKHLSNLAEYSSEYCNGAQNIITASAELADIDGISDEYEDLSESLALLKYDQFESEVLYAGSIKNTTSALSNFKASVAAEMVSSPDAELSR